jgi:GNAT superfamily N-acetyltransferase
MIRPIEIRDINKVVVLGKEMHQEGSYKDIPFDSQTFVSTVSHCMRNGFAWVGEKDGVVVCVMLATIGEYFFSKAKITTDLGLFVSKDHRKSRLALLLLKEYVSWGKQMGASEITMGSTNGHQGTGLKKFLENSLGFEYVGEIYKLRN